MSLIPEQLKSFDYYKSKLPLYLQNDEAFLQHFKIWFDFLIGESFNTGVSGIEDTLLALINIFDDNYLELINSLKTDPENENSNILDKLGNIFNIKRNFSVKYSSGGTNYNEEISLSDDEFLTFIKAQIIKNYSDGSYQQMREFYDKSNLKIYFKNNNPASVNVYLLETSISTYSTNIKHLFLAGLLAIESMGISYNYSNQSLTDIFVWDNTNWGEKQWVI